mmetsp:Transcript_7012/g.25863  ORF Transcript_7012/g.25863 Transcript_7012/m.25863 type:complete len:292 (+) Transcript_7012:272-1147(+)
MAKVQIPDKVVVHPLVLLSVVDHFHRVARDTRKRVVGVLLGNKSKGVVDVTNSYAVPFEEDESDSSIWFFDHNYHESMYHMFRRTNASESVVGWYSTGPKLRESDTEVNELMRQYCDNPVLVIIDPKPVELGLPTKAYVAIEEVKADGTEKSQKSFAHVTSEIGAVEAEEIGIEHMLRDVRDSTVSTLAVEVDGKVMALKGLQSRLQEIKAYLEDVAEGRLPIKQQIFYELQNIFNLLPNVNVEELVRSFAVKTNDMMLVIYVSSMIRSIIALHNLVKNKLTNKEYENFTL